MQEHRKEALVLKDPSGNLYAVPLDLLERLRVPEEHAAAVEGTLDDVAGHAAWPVVAVVALGVAAASAAGEAYLNYKEKWYATR